MEDYAFAVQLQEQLDREDKEAVTEIHNGHSTEKPLGIVDKRWETIDPTPDIRVLFQEFNKEFFWQRLDGVEVRWSPRMTSCAGICVYEGRGGLCSVRLSQPLLKLRPRSDLIETLLHEMIHAYLFVTHNDRDHDGHGPEFLKHMHRINSSTGAHLSVYHNFHDEVASHQQHWWRCDGRCQSRPPYFGYVRRAMNRAPSKNDPWFGQHMLTCGGTFEKIKEPEGYKDKSKTKKSSTGKVTKDRDIRQAFQQSNKKPPSTSTTTDSSLFPHTGHRLGSTATTSSHNGGNSDKTGSTATPATKNGGNSDKTNSFLPPPHAFGSHPTVILDTSSDSDTDGELTERMTLKRWSVSTGMIGTMNGKRPFFSSSDTDSDKYELGSVTAPHKRLHVESDTDSEKATSSLKHSDVDNTDARTSDVACDNPQVTCPNCSTSVTASLIHQHLDRCLM